MEKPVGETERALWTAGGAAAVGWWVSETFDTVWIVGALVAALTFTSIWCVVSCSRHS